MGVDSSISSRCLDSYVYDWRRACHDTCVETRQRRHSVFNRNRAVLLTNVSSSDIQFARCQEKVSY